MTLIGEIAGLATSFFFAATAVIFTKTGQWVGSQTTNRMRLLFAVLYLAALNWILYREPIPFSADSARWTWLSLSGIVGLSLGDAFLFQSLVTVGARLGSLLLSLAPIFGSIIAWVFLGEILSPLQILGIVLALSGIGWVVMSHKEPENTPHGHTRQGVIFGILAGLCQAVGLALSKPGMSDNYPAFQANMIRMLAAAFFIWIWSAFSKQIKPSFQSLRKNPRALKLIMLGSLIGPVLGVSSSLLSVQHAEIGVASTLMALPPVIVLPFSYFYFKEKIGWQALAGTALAIVGTAVLFLA